VLIFGERHEIDVVVGEHRHREVLGKPAANVEVFPAVHHAGAKNAGVPVVDARGQAEADPEHVANRAADLFQQSVRANRYFREHERRAALEIGREDFLGQDLRGEVGQCDARQAFADIHRDRQRKPFVDP